MASPETLPPPDAPASTDVSVHFFRNYNRLIGAAYALILAGLVVFFGFQLRARFASEVALIEANVKRHSQFVEYVIRSSLDQLDNLQMMVGGQVSALERSATGIARAPAHWPFFVEHQRGQERSFSLDKAPDIDMTGNLVGEGSLVGRSPDFYADMEQALLVNAGFRSLIFTLPNAARARFLATEHFLLTSPWRPSPAIAFGPDAYLDPIWRLGGADVNPDREKQWAPTYFGGKDQGLLVPVLVPVYRGARLVGVIAIDTSLDYLNRIYSDFEYPLGSLMLVDAFRQVLAHPGSYADPLAVEKTPALTDVMPQGVLPKDLTELPNDVHGRLGGQVVIAHRFVGAPWTQYYVVSEWDLWKRVLADRGMSMLATLLGLLAVMVATYLVTSLQFVGPAAKLVRHLAAESRFQPAAIPMVPTAWRPWFETVTRAFRESIQLMGLRKELDVAARMQSAMLPHAWPRHPRYELWGTMQAAKEVGGDFYDHFEVGQGLRGLTVADVSGKGIGPGLFGMMAKTLLRVTATQGSPEVTRVVEKVNDELSQDNDSCMFVTLVYALFSPDTGHLAYCNGGHLPPLRVCADGRVAFLPVGGGMALGIMGDMPYQSGEVGLEPGDTVLIYSDGVTEAMNHAQEEFGQDRLAALFEGRPCQTAREAVERVLAAVHAFAQGAEQSDDITCVALVVGPRERAS
jgi:sigma-B regulation protein RsbU (phosphoserine phosphatase)